jgi:hypothetical protein
MQANTDVSSGSLSESDSSRIGLAIIFSVGFAGDEFVETAHKPTDIHQPIASVSYCLIDRLKIV